MHYVHSQGITKQKTIGFGLIAVAVVAAVTMSFVFIGQSNAASKTPNNAGSLGKVTVGSDVSEWEVGSGQSNGEFVVATGQGVELGLRAHERKVGNLEVTGEKGNRVGVYEAKTGTSEAVAKWNYDWHVDLSNAKGNAAGKSLADYKLVLEQDFTSQSLFDAFGHDPVVLPMVDGVCFSGTFDSDRLCQQSWNPSFGNDDFNPEVEGSYNLRLVLTPETFNGPPLAVAIRVNVTE